MKSYKQCPLCKSRLSINQWGEFCSECGYVKMKNLVTDISCRLLMKRFIYKPTKNGCWECMSNYKDKDGYPHCTVNQKHVRIGKFVYEQKHGVLPSGMVVRHTCDNRSCINPKHLIAGTQADNMADRDSRGRGWWLKKQA